MSADTPFDPNDVYVVQGILTRAYQAFGDAFKEDVLEAERALARIQRALFASALGGADEGAPSA